MTTLTVYSSTDDGYIESQSGTWSVFQEGTGTKTVSTTGTTASLIGVSDFDNKGRTAFFSFDTSSLGAVNVISATITLWCSSPGVNSDVGGYFEVREAAVSGSLDTAEWMDDEAWAAATLCARKAMASFAIATTYAFTSQSGFASAINPTGTTWLALQHETFTGSGWVDYHMTVAFADTSGTTNDPKLVIVYEPPGNALFCGAQF